MNRKKLTAIALVLLLAAHVGILQAAAESAESSGTISFKEKEVTPPVDPENPSEPQEPPEVPGTGQEGDLTLDVVPYPDFGQYPVPTLNTNYMSKIKTGSASAQTFIQVSDARNARDSGWKILVKADPFTNTTDAGNLINGAEITFMKGHVRGTSGGQKPEAYQVSLNCVLGGQQTEDVIFQADSIVNAGTWIDCLYPTEPWEALAPGTDNSFIQLFIPAGSGAKAGGNYVSLLTWSLIEGP